MKRKNKIITITAAVAVVLFVAGVSAMAVGAFGSRTDPLVTLSYIDKTVEPEIEAYADNAVDALSETVDGKIAGFIDDLDERLEGAVVAGESDMFAVVTLSGGDNVNCGVGSELMLRSGRLTVSSEMTLSDTSSGSAVTGGASLNANHMYVVTDSGKLTASGSVTVLVKGEYTIS